MERSNGREDGGGDDGGARVGSRKLAQMFHSQPMTPNIDRGHHGGRCSNFEAVTSFTQNLNAVEVWVNSKTFEFTPTGTGQSCDLQGDESSMAVYACAL